MKNITEIRSSFLQGDTSMLETIYIDHHDDITNFIRSKKLCSYDEVEGLYNDAMIMLYEKITSGQLTEVKSIKNYLIGICINLVRRDNQKKSKIIEKIEEVRLHFNHISDNDTTDDYKSNLFKKVKKNLSTLSDKCQKIIIGYYLDSLTMKEIASHLNLSSGDVAKTLKSRCFKTLLTKLKTIKV